jgi:hypothetical protein
MRKLDIPIPIYQLANLRTLLYQIFTLDNNCKNSFDNTIWYLKETHTDKEIKAIINFLKSNGIKCDCDIVKNLIK